MTWETDFRRFKKWTWIISRAERITREFCFGFGLASDWSFFHHPGCSRSPALGACIYLFLLFFYFSFLSLWFPLFFLCILLAVMLAWTLRSGQPSKCPLISYVRSYVLHRPKGRDHRTGSRSDQIRSIHQSIKGKTNQNNTRVLSYVFRLSDIASRIVSFTYE